MRKRTRDVDLIRKINTGLQLDPDSFINRSGDSVILCAYYILIRKSPHTHLVMCNLSCVFFKLLKDTDVFLLAAHTCMFARFNYIFTNYKEHNIYIFLLPDPRTASSDKSDDISVSVSVRFLG